MKLSFLNVACAFAQSSVVYAAVSSNNNLRGNDSGVSAPTPSSAAAHRVLQVDQEVVFLVAVHEEGHPEARRLRELQGQGQGPPHETYNAEFEDGTILEIVNAESGWADGLTSGADTLKIPPGAIIAGAKIDLRGGKPDVVHGNAHGLFDRKRKLQQEQEDASTPEQKRNLAELHRQLAVVTGVKTVLAVRVIHDGTTDTTALTAYNGVFAPNYSKETLANDVFGTTIPGGSDLVNLHSQYKACSHGKLDFQPAIPRSSGNAKVTSIANGVVEVTVSTVCSSACNGQMRNDVNNALGNAFGTSASNIADHVMHCLPQGAVSGIAYAYINSWNSVYHNNWCRYTSTQLHELGHNLNLAHAGEGTNNYGDQSGFMGYSYSQDDQKMCFNNAKNWQLGWFSNETATIGLNEQFVGTLKGQVNYGNGDNDSKVVVKVKDPGSNLALYVGFNHRVKHNSATNEALNQVTIQEYTGNGYSQSYLVGKLGSGADWNRALGSSTVNVQVGTITPTSDPNFADDGVAPVTITYGTVVPTLPLTKAPTQAPQPPTPPPTNSPTAPPTTANPTTSPTPGPTGSPIVCPLAGIGEGCTDGTDCCSGSCSGGKKADRVCVSSGPTTPAPTPPPVNSPQQCLFCEATGQNCCSPNTCVNNGPPGGRGCYAP